MRVVIFNVRVLCPGRSADISRIRGSEDEFVWKLFRSISMERDTCKIVKLTIWGSVPSPMMFHPGIESRDGEILAVNISLNEPMQTIQEFPHVLSYPKLVLSIIWAVAPAAKRAREAKVFIMAGRSRWWTVKQIQSNVGSFLWAQSNSMQCQFYVDPFRERIESQSQDLRGSSQRLETTRVVIHPITTAITQIRASFAITAAEGEISTKWWSWTLLRMVWRTPTSEKSMRRN